MFPLFLETSIYTFRGWPMTWRHGVTLHPHWTARRQRLLRSSRSEHGAISAQFWCCHLNFVRHSCTTSYVSKFACDGRASRCLGSLDLLQVIQVPVLQHPCYAWNEPPAKCSNPIHITFISARITECNATPFTRNKPQLLPIPSLEPRQKTRGPLLSIILVG